MSDKKRADVLMVERGLAESRSKAQALIMSGVVYTEKVRIDKPSMLLTDEEITVREGLKYVSRGALKLEKGIRVFHVDPSDMVVMDVGASTGGFTDLLLQNGAAHVYSIDVGYGQLDWKLREDSRVTVMERTNARYLNPEDFERIPTLAVMDVSFISIMKILPSIERILADEGSVITLIKPQFEAGRDSVGKKGVVRDLDIHIQVIKTIRDFVQEHTRLTMKGLDYSPIKGPEGNIEFLAFLTPGKEDASVNDEEIVRVVDGAHTDLD